MPTARTITALLFSVAIASVAGCTPVSDKYELPKPEGWEEAKAGLADVTYVSPAEGANDDFREHVTVRGATPPGRTSRVSELAHNDLHRHKVELKEIKIQSEKEVSIAGKACYKVIYTYLDSGRHLKVSAYYFLFHASGMVLIGTATEASHERFAPQFERIAHTITFK